MHARSLVLSVSGFLAAAALAGSAQAAFFSFASDNDHLNYTFAGTAGAGGTFAITQDVGPSNFLLLVVPANGPFPPQQIATTFSSNLTATWANDNNVAGSLWMHTYTVSGTFGFSNPVNGDQYLKVTIGSGSPGVFTVPGTQTSWSSTGAVLGADSFADVTYTFYPALIAALGGGPSAMTYGISVPNGISGDSTGPDDFAFDLSVMNAGTMGINVMLNPQTHLPTTTWKSESSFSGSATGLVPTPGAAGLLGLAGLATLRRRRA